MSQLTLRFFSPSRSLKWSSSERQGIGGAGAQSAMSEDFGVYGSDPRSKATWSIRELFMEVFFKDNFPEIIRELEVLYGFLLCFIRQNYEIILENWRFYDRQNIDKYWLNMENIWRFHYRKRYMKI